MASNDDLYLPDLSRFFCLEQRIISWQNVYDDLRDTTIDHKTKRAVRFLRNTTPEKILKEHRCSLGRPDSTSKSQFEAKTAAINVPLSGSLHCDIGQIKADTLWLSESFKISETGALRTVLLEWQRRPQCELGAGYSEPEIASLNQVAASTVSGFGKSIQTLPKSSDVESDTENARRRRQVLFHFRESISLIKVWLVLLEAQVRQECDTTTTFARSLVEAPETYTRHVRSIIEITDEITKGPAWSIVDETIEETWYAGQIHCIQALMDVVVAYASMEDAFPAAVVSDWYQLLKQTNFFSNVRPTLYLSITQTQAFQTSVVLTTIALLGPLLIMSSPSPPKDHTWASDLEVLSAVSEITFNGVDENVPYTLPLSWMLSLMLKDVHNRADEAKHRREDPHIQKAIDQTATLDTASGRRGSMVSSLQESVWEEMLDVISSINPDDQHPIQTLYLTSIDRGAIDVLVQMTDTIKSFSHSYVRYVYRKVVQETLILADEVLGYCTEVLEPQLSLLDSTTNLCNSTPASIDEPSTIFAHSEHLMSHIFATAAGRFPHDTLPFLRLCRCLATSDHFNEKGVHHITFLLQNLDCFTHTAVEQFAQYRTIREDENLNLVALNHTIQPLVQGQTKSVMYERNTQVSLVIPADTQGTVISEGTPPIVKWDLTYSGLALMGKWLDLHYQHQLQPLLCEEESASEVVAEVMLLLANLLTNTSSSHNSVDEDQRQSAVTAILDDANMFYVKGFDVVNRVFDIMQQELQRFRQHPQNTFDTNLTTACVCFSHAILRMRPVHFWAAVGRTEMVGTHGESSLLHALVTGTEMFTGDFRLTRSIAALFTDMIEAALLRPLSLNRSATATPTTSLLNNASKQYELVLQGMTADMLDVYDELIKRTGIALTDAGDIVASLSSAFARILTLRYDFGQADIPTSLNACYDPAAALIMNRLRPLLVPDAQSGAIALHLLSVASRPTDQIFDDDHEGARSVLDLTSTILRCVQTLKLPVAGFESALLNLTPIVVRQIALSGLSESATCLLATLLDVVRHSSSASLLGYLGSQTSLLLLNVLSSQQVSAERTIQIATWRLLRHLISLHQQWLAIVLLTGKAPTRSENTREDVPLIYRGKLLFDVALDRLNEISQLDNAVAYAVLQFVTQAQQNWSWAVQSTTRDDVFTTIISYALNLPDKSVSGSALHILGQIVDVWSTRLHYAKATRSALPLKQFEPFFDWLTNNAIKTTGYNASLHSNLQKNFMTKFGLSLDNFKVQRPDGAVEEERGYYDLSLADVVLGKKPHWTARGRGANQSYSAEVQRANANLAIVNGETTLLRSFQNLCIEHAAYIAENEQMRHTMAHIVLNCLKTNKEMFQPGVSAEQTLQSRAEMSLALMQHLVQKQQKSGVNFRSLLVAAWECTVSAYSSYEAAIANDGLNYWRTLLSIVLLSLRFHRRNSPATPDNKRAAHASPRGGSASELIKRSESSDAVVLEIVTVVVGDGLASVVLLLQEAKQAEMQNQKASIGVEVNGMDIILIVRMCETILSLGHMSELSTQMSERLLASSTTRAATQLYACSHLLTSEEIGGEPIYAEPSMKLMASISTLPMIAEEMAVEGILSRMLTARVTQVLQKVSNGVSHVDTRPHCQLLYRIWSEGILPLTLNLLHGVRGQIVSEVSSFLNQFPSQLSKASSAFSRRADQRITLSLSKEAATLALIAYALDTYRSAGPSAAIDPSSVLSLEGYDEHRKVLGENISELVGLTKGALKERIVPLDERELAWYKDDTLTNKVLAELQSALLCLKKDEAMSGQP